MLFDMLMLFIMIVVVCMILSVILMENDPMIGIPFILIGMVFCIIVTYGFWDVEYFYVGYNASVGNSSSYVYSTSVYGDPYSYIFILLFFIFCIVFVKCGFNIWREALKTQGELNLNKR